MDCKYCDKPLDHGPSYVVNGLHKECNEKFNEELAEWELNRATKTVKETTPKPSS